MKNLFKYASLLVAAAMLFACEGNVDNPDDGGGETIDPNAVLKVTSDKDLIQVGNDVATLTVTLDGKEVKDDVVFYDADKNVIEIPNFKFSTAVPGRHKITAGYGTYFSEPVTVTAINVKVPVTPDDPKPNSTEFKARMLVTEVTTTGCTFCPGMKSILHPALEDERFADKVVFTACHNTTIGGVADPAYVHTGYAENDPPYLYCDMYTGTGYYKSWVDSDPIIDFFNKAYGQKEKDAVGIAVNSSIVDGQLVAKVTVKPAVSGSYRVGAFLLEDGVYGRQTGDGVQDWMSTHDGVIRYIDSRYTVNGMERFYGHLIGEIEAGDTADYAFVWMLDDIWAEGNKKCESYGASHWQPFVEENLHLAVFVSTTGDKFGNGNDVYYVNNVIDCPVNGLTPFEYR